MYILFLFKVLILSMTLFFRAVMRLVRKLSCKKLNETEFVGFLRQWYYWESSSDVMTTFILTVLHSKKKQFSQLSNHSLPFLSF